MGTNHEDSASGTRSLESQAGTVSKQHGTFRCSRGYDLYTTTYTPTVRRTAACLIFHHGLSDHSERHAHVLSHLCASLGMPIYTYDAHGHGRSGPDGPVGRALIRSFHHMVGDLLDFTRQHVVPAEQKAAEAAAAAATAAEPQGPESAAEAEVEAEDVPARSGTSGSGSDSEPDGGGGGADARGRERERGRRAWWRDAPRIFLLGYSMGGLTCCLAVASTSSGSTPPPAGSRASCSAASTAAAAAPEPPSSDEASGSDAAPASECASASAATAAAASGPSSSSSTSSSSLYAGLMLTSCLTDPLHGSSLLMRAIKMAYVSALARLAPALPFFKRNPVESGIRDPRAVAQMAADKLWYRGKFKAATIASLLWGCARLRWCAHRIRLPLYVQHATVDMSCSLPSMRAFLSRVACPDATLHVVQGAFHDLHHDPETPVLLGRMVEWLAPRV